MSMGTCTFDGCERPVYVKKRGLCHGHYQQMWLGRPLTPIGPYKRLRQPSPDTKVCTDCYVVKALDSFYDRSSGGKQSKCKECMRARETARRQARKPSQEATQGA